MNKRLYQILICLLIIAFTIATPLCSFAYNADYLDHQKWSNNDNVINRSINNKSAFGTLKGDVRYYVDNYDNCLYVCFDVTEQNIFTNDDVSIEFKVKNSDERYSFSVNENGIYQMQDGVLDNFTAYSNFETGTNNTGVYVVALDIHNGSKVNYVDMVFHTVAKYDLSSIGTISVIVPTTTKASKTTKAKATKAKSKAKGKSSSKSNRAVKQKTTKYYNPNPTYPTKASNSVEVEEETTFNNTVKYSVENNEKVISKNSSWLLIASAIIGTVGVMLVIFGIVFKFIKSKENEDEDKDKDEPNDEDEFDF